MTQNNSEEVQIAVYNSTVVFTTAPSGTADRVGRHGHSVELSGVWNSRKFMCNYSLYFYIYKCLSKCSRPSIQDIQSRQHEEAYIIYNNIDFFMYVRDDKSTKAVL